MEPWTALKTVREKDGHSLSSLARAAADADGKPMSLGYLSDLENGKREPNARITKQLATALNVPVSVIEKQRRGDDPEGPVADIEMSNHWRDLYTRSVAENHLLRGEAERLRAQLAGVLTRADQMGACEHWDFPAEVQEVLSSPAPGEEADESAREEPGEGH